MKKILTLLLLSFSLFSNAQWFYTEDQTARTKFKADNFDYVVVHAEPDSSIVIGTLWQYNAKWYSKKKTELSFSSNQITGLSTVATSGNYTDLAGKPLIPTNNNQLTNGANYLTSEVDGSITNELQNLTLSGNLLSISNGNSVTLPVANNYTAGNGIVITGTSPNLTISVVQPTVTVVTSKVLNSNFTISTTKPAIVSYAVSCTVTNPLLIGTSTATTYLEYSLNSGTTWLTPSQSGNSSGVGVTVAIQLTNTQTGTLTGVIPANALVRIRTATTGTASVNYVTGTEITY